MTNPWAVVKLVTVLVAGDQQTSMVEVVAAGLTQGQACARAQHMNGQLLPPNLSTLIQVSYACVPEVRE